MADARSEKRKRERRGKTGRIALGGLRRRWRENAALILGVLLAVFFLSTALFGLFTMYASGTEYNEKLYGRADLAVWNVEGKDCAALVSDGVLEEYVVEEILFVVLGDLQNATDNFSIARYTPELDAMSRFVLSDGRMPEKEGEIAVERSALMKLRVDFALDEPITLTLSCFDGQTVLSESTQRTFTLVGILQSKENSGYNASNPFFQRAQAVVSAQEPLPAGARESKNLLGVLCRGADYETFTDWAEENEARVGALSGEPTGAYYLRSFGEDMQTGDISSTIILWVSVAVFGALSVVAMAGIASALTANVDKRRTQIGLLRAVGATQTQVRRILMQETLCIAAVSLPVGILLAIGVVLLVRRAYPDFVVLYMPAWLVALDIAACTACVFVSSWLPVRRSTRISPMQVVRDVEKMHRFRKKGWKSRGKYTPARLMATRVNALRGGRTRSMVALITAGCLLFSLAVMLCGYGIENVRSNHDTMDFSVWAATRNGTPFVNSYYFAGRLTDQDCREVQALPYVKQVRSWSEMKACALVDVVTDYITVGGYASQYTYLSPEVPAYKLELLDGGYYGLHVGNILDDFAEDAQEDYDDYCALKEQMGWDKEAIALDFIGLDEAVIEEMMGAGVVYEGRIDLEKLASGEEVLVYAPQYFGVRKSDYDGSWEYYYADVPGGLTGMTVYENDMFHAGDTLDLSVLCSVDAGEYVDGELVRSEELEETRRSVTIGAVLGREVTSLVPLFCEKGIVTSEDGMRALGLAAQVMEIEVWCDPFPDEQTYRDVAEQIEAISMRVDGAVFYDSHASTEEDRFLVYIGTLACSAVLILLLGFSFAMLSSTVAGRIQSDVHQIGTMRAAGASRRVVFCCYAWQLYCMFLLGGGVGWALYLAVLWMAREIYVWHMPALYVAAHVCAAPVYAAALMALCLLVVHIRLRPVFRASVVENIRVL